MPRSGQFVAFLAGLTQVWAGFLAWNGTGQAGLDVDAPWGGSIGVTLVVVAGVPLLWLLVGDRGWPRVLSATVTAVLVVAHLRGGPDGMATAGVLAAMWAAIGQWLAAALATGPLVDLPRLQPRA